MRSLEALKQDRQLATEQARTAVLGNLQGQQAVLKSKLEGLERMRRHIHWQRVKPRPQESDYKRAMKAYRQEIEECRRLLKQPLARDWPLGTLAEEAAKALGNEAV